MSKSRILRGTPLWRDSSWGSSTWQSPQKESSQCGALAASIETFQSTMAAIVLEVQRLSRANPPQPEVSTLMVLFVCVVLLVDVLRPTAMYPIFDESTRHTNNTGEITALVMVMEMLGLIGAQRCVFRSDSMYALDLAQSRSRASTNTELVEVLLASAWHLKERQGCDTDFVHVRGHSGEPLNDFADALAGFAGGSDVPLIVHPLCISVQSLDRRVRLYRERGWYSDSLATGSVSLPPAVMFPQPGSRAMDQYKTFPSLPSFSMASINVGTLDSADARKP